VTSLPVTLPIFCFVTPVNEFFRRTGPLWAFAMQIDLTFAAER